MKRLSSIALLVVASLALSGCWWEEGEDTERGRGDTAVDHINQGPMDLAIEMGDGFLNIGHKCVGPTGYLTSTKGNGGAGALTPPVFMDPFCLGIYDIDGTVNGSSSAATSSTRQH